MNEITRKVTRLRVLKRGRRRKLRVGKLNAIALMPYSEGLAHLDRGEVRSFEESVRRARDSSRKV